MQLISHAFSQIMVRRPVSLACNELLHISGEHDVYIRSNFELSSSDVGRRMTLSLLNDAKVEEIILENVARLGKGAIFGRRRIQAAMIYLPANIGGYLIIGASFWLDGTAGGIG